MGKCIHRMFMELHCFHILPVAAKEEEQRALYVLNLHLISLHFYQFCRLIIDETTFHLHLQISI